MENTNEILSKYMKQKHKNYANNFNYITVKYAVKILFVVR